MKNKLKELYNKKPSKLTPDPYYRKFMNKHTLRLTLNTTYTEIYDKSTKVHLNDQEGIVDSLKGKLVDVIIAHEGITKFKKSKRMKEIMHLEYLHYNKTNICIRYTSIRIY